MRSLPDDITDSFARQPAYSTSCGQMYEGNTLDYLQEMPDACVDLVVTSPPFALVRKKDYGNKDEDEYVEWFMKFGREVYRVLKESGSFVIDIGGSWIRGAPVRSTYHYDLMIELTSRGGFHLAQDFFWYSPSKLPTPAEWVTVRKIRVKDAINPIWWLSKTEYPKASNRRVSMQYSEAMLDLFENGYKAKKRPSGHNISDKFGKNRGGSIPPNLIVVSHTSSNDYYQQRCKAEGIDVHPARFPPDIPLFFIAMLTDPGDLVLDIFGGSNVTGWVCEHFDRRWLAFDSEPEYIEGSKFRFEKECPPPSTDIIGSPNSTQFRPVRVRREPKTLTRGQERPQKKAE